MRLSPIGHAAGLYGMYILADLTIIKYSPVKPF